MNNELCIKLFKARKQAIMKKKIIKAHYNNVVFILNSSLLKFQKFMTETAKEQKIRLITFFSYVLKS